MLNCAMDQRLSQFTRQSYRVNVQISPSLKILYWEPRKRGGLRLKIIKQEIDPF